MSKKLGGQVGVPEKVMMLSRLDMLNRHDEQMKYTKTHDVKMFKTAERDTSKRYGKSKSITPAGTLNRSHSQL